MIVDASALLAIIGSEPERGDFIDALDAAESRSMSVVNHFEVAIKVDRSRDPILSRRFADLIDEGDIELAPVSVEQAAVARAAYRDFGKGSGHPAQLNLGDCFAYALATVTKEPLLYKGNDFVHTDIRSAV
ncbi:type II toxin-antitoxin system VapC family toxin [Nocardia brasiliensis]|uniref:type II toxin-antitoxin system VapC family toxin n=1 Tax=Nocardia brasiliensis TaxID=37326 RepID=UPI0004A76F4F|nr:type II toxin-antitoxin system VapC family toxin [Nocardia brasiliensis]MBF6124256.1 type II toxin-antitoxin system VapC family toxin [Nocardia brasiliensis]MBF6544068.1 type II toxin-antitoxin system VapC family toxin [Nocardia brasiliensis]